MAAFPAHFFLYAYVWNKGTSDGSLFLFAKVEMVKRGSMSHIRSSPLNQCIDTADSDYNSVANDSGGLKGNWLCRSCLYPTECFGSQQFPINNNPLHETTADVRQRADPF